MTKCLWSHGAHKENGIWGRNRWIQRGRDEQGNSAAWLDRWGAQNNTDPAISSDFFFFLWHLIHLLNWLIYHRTDFKTTFKLFFLPPKKLANLPYGSWILTEKYISKLASPTETDKSFEPLNKDAESVTGISESSFENSFINSIYLAKIHDQCSTSVIWLFAKCFSSWDKKLLQNSEDHLEEQFPLTCQTLLSPARSNFMAIGLILK